MYQALYRKWRPRTFDDVSGQAHITETLKNQVRTGRLSHAYLFIGTRGTGKTTCAKILAKAVNCENPVDGNPCNKCRACLGIDSGAIMDVVEMDAASNNGVDNVRALRDEAIFSPASVRKRVYIVDEVHMLSASAFNALLKILEEPPEHLMFILATTELNKVPATILSRCQRHSFKRLDSAVIAERIRYVAGQENIKIEPEAAELLGRLADGAMRDGLSLLDQCAGAEVIDRRRVLDAMGLAGGGRTAALFDAVCQQDTSKALRLFDELWRDGKAPQTLLNELSTLQRDILIRKIAPKGGRELLSGMFDEDVVDTFSSALTSGALLYGLTSIQNALMAMRDSAGTRTAAELCLVELCEPQLNDSIPALRARIAKLEQALSGSFAILPAAEHWENPVTEPDTEPERIRTHTAPEPVLGPASEKPKVSPEPVHTSEETVLADSGETWSRMLTILEETMNRGAYTVVSDSYHVEAELTDAALILRAKNVFAMGMMKSQENQEKLRDALSRTLGRTLPIKLEEVQAQQGANTEKLDALSKFSNVSFK